MSKDRIKQRVVAQAILAALAVAVVIFIGVFATHANKQPLWNTEASEEEARQAYEYVPNPNSTLVKFTEGVYRWYVHEALQFSFRLPDGFTAPDGKLVGEETYVVLVSNGKGADVEVVATRITTGADTPLTEDIVRTQLQGEVADGFKQVSLPDGTTGLQFETDSLKWEGGGVAFWFSKNGYLFTITTNKNSKELLELVLGTWKFGLPVAPLPN